MTNEGIGGINRDTSTICVENISLYSFLSLLGSYQHSNKQKTKYNGQINFNRCWCWPLSLPVQAAAPATTTLSPSDERVNLVELLFTSGISELIWLNTYLFPSSSS
ncbi:ATM_1a_G0028320.mRNA.1.CDS.1 [Saccharomyces cerevisiae]|nr:ATM_1a_G0028320.mRNA.1.CDS.1 [Saccharomyces cerevisiae]CAI7096346.1 ATM_1a_G0028320.mRNA.1.CDS.1 [Saccharomyces cerevisiae]